MSTNLPMSTNLRQVTAALLALALLAAGIADTIAQPTARLAVSPHRYEVSFDQRGGRTEALMVKNLSDEPVTVRITLANWDLDQDNQVRVIEPREDSLDQWLVVNPLQVTIPPDTPQTIRWAIMPRQAPQTGEYRALLFVEELLDDKPTQTGTQLRMKMRMGIPVYAQYGDAVDAAAIDRVGADRSGAAIELALSNVGNRHARLQGLYGVWPADRFPGSDRAISALRATLLNDQQQEGFTAHRLEEVVVLPGNQRTTTITPDLPRSGQYTVQFDATFANATLQQTVGVERRD
jgi:P pilus assembly chaperone PapD